MKERPILFSAPMVCALLDGSKTQTRRIAKVPENATDVWYWSPPGGSSKSGWSDPGLNYWTPDPNGATLSNHIDPCPYGQLGDRLWVRETHSLMGDTQSPTSCWYRADGKYPQVRKWTPSIFMRRMYSRILLEIVSVRVERLNNCSEADAIAEGIERSGQCNWRDYLDDGNDFTGPRFSYRSLWESINGPGSWAANPWVWVIEFKRITKTGEPKQ